MAHPMSLRTTERVLSNDSTTNQWGWLLLGFAAAIFFILIVFGALWYLTSKKKKTKSATTKSSSKANNKSRHQQESHDIQDLPAVATGSMSVGDAVSEATSRKNEDSNNNSNNNSSSSKQDESKEEGNDTFDYLDLERNKTIKHENMNDSIQGDDVDDDRSLWNYSVRSFADTTVGGGGGESVAFGPNESTVFGNDTSLEDASVASIHSNGEESAQAAAAPSPSTVQSARVTSRVYHGRKGNVLFDI